ncbi:MAG: lysophospholipid acyltransferase family protein [Candidatus Omnitrophica bacterium]|nr:lysophospholipid acyltransferase family protein [Candidatus Omnitrophota bacterium]
MKRFYFYAVARALSRVLPKPAAAALAKGAAALYGNFFSKDLPAIQSNLRAVLPAGSDTQKESRALIASFFLYFVDLFYGRSLSAEWIEKKVRITGRPYLDEALARKKGVILVSGHVGNWELGGMVLAALGYRLHGIAIEHADKRIERIFRDRRARHGLGVIPHHSPARRYFEVLNKNEILALNADRLFRGEGVPADFLGRRVFFPGGFPRIAASSGAPVVPVFFVSTPDGGYELDIQEPIPLSTTEEMVQNFASRLEKKIKQRPRQWFIFEPFWEPPRWPV